jgi:hypothetical protein
VKVYQSFFFFLLGKIPHENFKRNKLNFQLIVNYVDKKEEKNENIDKIVNCKSFSFKNSLFKNVSHFVGIS